MKNELVPKDFFVPESLSTKHFWFEPLSPRVAEIDYEAVMSSRERLRKVFESNDTWPKDEMTLEENISDLERHEKEFYERKAFAYTVLSPNKEKCLGCVYIDPPTDTQFDCEAYLWVRDSEIPLDKELFITVKNWLDNSWPFSNPSFPGREVEWTNRNELKNSKNS